MPASAPHSDHPSARVDDDLMSTIGVPSNTAGHRHKSRISDLAPARSTVCSISNSIHLFPVPKTKISGQEQPAAAVMSPSCPTLVMARKLARAGPLHFLEGGGERLCRPQLPTAIIRRRGSTLT